MANKNNNEIILKYDMHFTALKDRKKFRGVVEYRGYGGYSLCNNKFGEESNHGDGFEGFSHAIGVYIPLGTDATNKLKELGITNFVECKDRRQKAIIDGDRNPEIMNMHVKVDGDEFIFGCGAVLLTRKQITNYVTVKEKMEGIALSDLAESLESFEGGFDYDDIVETLLSISDKDIKALTDAHKILKSVKGGVLYDYNWVREEAKDNDQLEELEKVSVKDIKWLLANY